MQDSCRKDFLEVEFGSLFKGLRSWTSLTASSKILPASCAMANAEADLWKIHI